LTIEPIITIIIIKISSMNFMMMTRSKEEIIKLFLLLSPLNEQWKLTTNQLVDEKTSNEINYHL
jgi:hypothetical protein